MSAGLVGAGSLKNSQDITALLRPEFLTHTGKIAHAHLPVFEFVAGALGISDFLLLRAFLESSLDFLGPFSKDSLKIIKHVLVSTATDTSSKIAHLFLMFGGVFFERNVG